MPALTPRVVLITGASSGLGAATAVSCARAGHHVALAARRVERLQEVADRIDAPGRVFVVSADMRSPESIREMVARTEERFGRIDALLANAGVGHGGPFLESTEEQLMDQVEVNVLAVVRCAREVLPGMLRRGNGHILTVSSVAAEIPSAQSVVYAATKGAVSAFSEALRRELRGKGVHVTTILPGFVESEMTARNPIKMPPASIVGDLVVDLLRRPRPRAVVPRYYGAFIWGNRFFPGVVDGVLDRLQADLERRIAAAPRALPDAPAAD